MGLVLYLLKAALVLYTHLPEDMNKTFLILIVKTNKSVNLSVFFKFGGSSFFVW